MCSAGIPEFHTAIKLGRYYRVRYENDAGAQSIFRLSTYFGDNFLPTNAPANQALGIDQDAIATRSVSAHQLDVSRGFVGGQYNVHKFGKNPSITASTTEDVIFTGIINWLQTASTVRVKSGGNVNDTSAGTGARSVIIQGLDENWEVVTEEVDTAGASASSATTTTFIRVFRAYVEDTGTYSGTNVGNVTIETTGGTTLVTIPAGLGQTETSAYTIPAGKTGYLTNFNATVDANKACDIIMWRRERADIVTAPFSSNRQVSGFTQLVGSAERRFGSYIVFPEKTDIWVTATTGSGANASVQADYDLIIVDN